MLSTSDFEITVKTNTKGEIEIRVIPKDPHKIRGDFEIYHDNCSKITKGEEIESIYITPNEVED